MDVVLHGLAAGHHLHVAGRHEAAAMLRQETADQTFQVGPGGRQLFVEPELHPRGPLARRFQQRGQHFLVAAKNVVGEAQPMRGGNDKRNVHRVGVRVIHLTNTLALCGPSQANSDEQRAGCRGALFGEETGGG